MAIEVHVELAQGKDPAAALHQSRIVTQLFTDRGWDLTHVSSLCLAHPVLDPTVCIYHYFRRTTLE
jgi:hypothetical protein